MALAAIVLAFSTAWDLALVIIGMMPLVITTISLLSKRLSVVSRSYHEGRNAAVAVAKTALSTIETIKCFQGQPFESSQYARSLTKAAKQSHHQATISALQVGIVRFMTVAVFAQGFWYGSQMILTGARTTKDIITVFWACVIAMYALQEALPHIIILEKGKVAATLLQPHTFAPSKSINTKQSNSIGADDFRKGSIKLSNASVICSSVVSL